MYRISLIDMRAAVISIKFFHSSAKRALRRRSPQSAASERLGVRGMGNDENDLLAAVRGARRLTRLVAVSTIVFRAKRARARADDCRSAARASRRWLSSKSTGFTRAYE